jgi:CxxC motif-containing protein (DUF1111 family)
MRRALIEDIILSDIQAAQAAEPEALRGRLNVLDDGRIGRFGWKAQTSTLVEFIAQADAFQQGSWTGSEFRTAPLWRVSDRLHFLHDGRAATILDAILAHGGQAADAIAHFQALSAADQQALLAFLNGI